MYRFSRAKIPFFVKSGLVCSNWKKLESSIWLRYGRVFEQVLNLSIYACLLPNKTLTQCFCAVHALFIMFL